MDREETGVGEGEEDEVQRKTAEGQGEGLHTKGTAQVLAQRQRAWGGKRPGRPASPLPLSIAELPHWSLPAMSTIPPWHRFLSVSLPLSPMLAAFAHSETTLAMPRSSSLAQCLPQL